MNINQLIELNKKFTTDIDLFKTELDKLEKETKLKVNQKNYSLN